MCVTDKNSKNAVTHYEVLEEFSGYSFVRLKLETGRTHQIRVHMAYLGHPVAATRSTAQRIASGCSAGSAPCGAYRLHSPDDGGEDTS